MSATVAAPSLLETKVANTPCLDAKPLDLSQPAEPAAPEEDFADIRKRFVGDVNLDEKDEPLLKESKRRFVLFPIQYNEVLITLRG